MRNPGILQQRVLNKAGAGTSTLKKDPIYWWAIIYKYGKKLKTKIMVRVGNSIRLEINNIERKIDLERRIGVLGIPPDKKCR